MIAAEFEPAFPDGRRRSPRAPVSLDARLDGSGVRRTLCKIVDMSIHGARLQTYSSLKKGTTIWLSLPIIGDVAADVKWADDFVAGCQFLRPIERDQYEQIIDLHGGPLSAW